MPNGTTVKCNPKVFRKEMQSSYGFEVSPVLSNDGCFDSYAGVDHKLEEFQHYRQKDTSNRYGRVIGGLVNLSSPFEIEISEENSLQISASRKRAMLITFKSIMET
ncbi:hypothetical protein FQR65_LT01849 [Abscondita terminalis]|nr:hypothetical protein FQR65_LT01849 [Abscondita terminalis]